MVTGGTDKVVKSRRDGRGELQKAKAGKICSNHRVISWGLLEPSGKEKKVLNPKNCNYRLTFSACTQIPLP